MGNVKSTTKGSAQRPPMTLPSGRRLTKADRVKLAKLGPDAVFDAIDEEKTRNLEASSKPDDVALAKIHRDRRTAITQAMLILTPAFLGRLEGLLSTVQYVSTVCSMLNIPRRTFYYWKNLGDFYRRKDSEELTEREELLVNFSQAVERGVAQGEFNDLQTITEASQRNWRAAAWRLERRAPRRWAANRHERTDGDIMDDMPYPTPDFDDCDYEVDDERSIPVRPEHDLPFPQKGKTLDELLDEDETAAEEPQDFESFLTGDEDDDEEEAGLGSIIEAEEKARAVDIPQHNKAKPRTDPASGGASAPWTSIHPDGDKMTR